MKRGIVRGRGGGGGRGSSSLGRYDNVVPASKPVIASTSRGNFRGARGSSNRGFNNKRGPSSSIVNSDNVGERIKPKRSTSQAHNTKYKIRSLKRLLDNPKIVLPDDVKEKKQLELKELYKQLKVERKDQSKIEHEAKIQQKIRFFERVKLTRQIKRALADEKHEKEKADVDELVNKLKYVLFYPPKEKYVSIFNKLDSEEENEKRNKLIEHGVNFAQKKNFNLEEFLSADHKKNKQDDDHAEDQHVPDFEDDEESKLSENDLSEAKSKSAEEFEQPVSDEDGSPDEESGEAQDDFFAR